MLSMAALACAGLFLNHSMPFPHAFHSFLSLLLRNVILIYLNGWNTKQSPFLSNLRWLQTAISRLCLPISTCRIYTSFMIYIVPSHTGSSASRFIETVSKQCQTVLRIPQVLFHNIIWHTFPSLQLFITASNLHKEDSSYPTGGPTAIHFSDMVMEHVGPCAESTKLPQPLWPLSGAPKPSLRSGFFFLKKKPLLKKKTKANYSSWLWVIDSLIPTPWKTFTLQEACATGRADAAGNPGMVIINHFPFLGDSGMVHIK